MSHQFKPDTPIPLPRTETNEDEEVYHAVDFHPKPLKPESPLPHTESHESLDGVIVETYSVQLSDHFAQPVMERPPFSSSFWGGDSQSAKIRKTYLIILARGCLMTAVAILSILSIYWGALWKVEDGIHNLNGWVVDFDGGAMGRAVQAAATNATGPKEKLSWTIMPASRFPGGSSDVIQAVLDEACWVAIVVSPNATSKLNSAVGAARASYDGSSAATIYALEARNENSYPLIIAPSSQGLMNAAVKTYANQHARQLATHRNLSRILSNAPNVVTQPMSYTLQNLRPFDVAAASAADFVGLIYLLIISFLITNLTFMARMESGLARHLSLGSLVQVRIFSAVSMYFFLSLIFSLLSLAFQIPFDRMYGRVGFFIFWMLSWMAMCALGLALEAIITLVTPRFTPYFMILWIIIDVAVCFYPIEILPGVFKYGYATPFYNVSRAVRSIIFRTRNQLGLNFGVEFAWIAISLVTIPLFQWFRRRGEVQAWRTAKRASHRQSRQSHRQSRMSQRHSPKPS